MTWNRILALAALVLGLVAAILAGVSHDLQTAVIFAGVGVACAGAALLL